MRGFIQRLRALRGTKVRIYTKTINGPLTGGVLTSLQGALSPSVCLFVGTVRKLGSPLDGRSVHFFARLSGLFRCSLQGTPTR